MKLQLCAAGMIAAVAAVSFSFAQENLRAPSGPPAQLNVPPGYEPRQPDAPPPIECDLKASPDYVPGIDVNGRDVAPADLPTGRQVEIDTQVYVETRSKTRERQRTGVVVNLPGLGAPACVPVQEKSPN
jgi:hypothetical protein